MEVAYTLGFQDWISAYRIGIANLRPIPFAAFSGILASMVCFVAVVGVSYYGYALAWTRHHAFPWHYVSIMVAAAAMGPAAFAFSHWSMSARKVGLGYYGIVVQSKFSGKVSLPWRRVSGIFQEPEHIAICSKSFAALIIPHRAFPNEQAAIEFFDMALHRWHKAKGTMPLSIPDTIGVWPPAPRGGNSAEPGDTPFC